MDDKSFNVNDELEALRVLHQARKNQQFVTGLFYFNKDKQSLLDEEHLVSRPLCELNEVELRPSPESLAKIQDFYA